MFQNTNATAVLLDICESDITKYMTIPPTVTTDMNNVKERFCDTNFDVLMEEFVDAFFIEDIINMVYICIYMLKIYYRKSLTIRIIYMDLNR